MAGPLSIPLSILICLLGILCNLAFSGVFLQPDWAMAWILAALLAHRGNWLWVAMIVMVHDLILHWSPLVSLPWVLLAPVMIAWSDAQIGPSLFQRSFAMLFVVGSLLLAGWSLSACLLTLLLCLVFWHMIARLYAQPA